jgi:hypothetical protein
MATRQRREYLILLKNAKAAAETAIDAFNRVNHSYRNETTLLTLANAWELLAKSMLVHAKQSIIQGHHGETISGEKAVHRLLCKNQINKHEHETIQQIISLRNAAAHHFLPEIPDEIIHHLLYFGCKFFRAAIKKTFPSHGKGLDRNYLSLAFSDLTTYADKVQKSVSRVKKSPSAKRLIWLLERGIEFDGNSYQTEKQFEASFKGKKKIMPHLALNNFVKENEMVRIVPVEAPRNYTADITLRKGKAQDSTLPVVVRKTDVNQDYPYLTKEIATALGISIHETVEMVKKLQLKNDPKYHQAVRVSTTHSVQRYSEAAKTRLSEELGTTSSV